MHMKHVTRKKAMGRTVFVLSKSGRHFRLNRITYVLYNMIAVLRNGKKPRDPFHKYVVFQNWGVILGFFLYRAPLQYKKDFFYQIS